MDIRKDLTEEIAREIAFAIRKLGGKPGALNLTDSWAVNRLLKFLGADIYLFFKQAFFAHCNLIKPDFS
jgi:hypothetical protein